MSGNPGDPDFIKLPIFRRKKQEKLAGRILLDAVETYRGDADRWKASLCDRLMDTLGLVGDAAKAAIAGSLTELETQKLRQCTSCSLSAVEDRRLKLCRRLATRLAANLHMLERGNPVSDTLIDTPPHIARGIVVGFFVRQPTAASGRNRHKEKNLEIYWLVETGPSAGRTVKTRVSRSRMLSIFARLVNRIHGCPLTSPRLLISLQAALKLKTVEDQLVVVEIGVSKSQFAENRKLTRSRFRKFAVCPYRKAMDCFICSVGLNECSRSTNPKPTQVLTRG